jgi:hypothetical protein
MENLKTYEDVQEIDCGGEHHYQLGKVRVSKKVLTMYLPEWKDGQYERITFQKSDSKPFGTRLEITAAHHKMVSCGHEVKKCDLGHEHNIEVKKQFEYKHVMISMRWEDVERLIEWLQLGSWKDLRNK